MPSRCSARVLHKGAKVPILPRTSGLFWRKLSMSDFPTFSLLSDAELDAVAGGNYSSTSTSTTTIRQNARGGDSIALAGNGGAANATTGAATTGTAAAKTGPTRISKWYPTDANRKVRRNPAKAPKAVTLRRNITPGTVLILLVGRFKGKRVVFLRQLKSGLLLVTGPFKLNGVPLRRVNQSTVIPTSTKVKIEGVKTDAINDDFFSRGKTKRTKKSEEAFFASGTAEKSQEEKDRIGQKKKTQTEVDGPILAAVKKEELLRQYLKSRFTLSKFTRPHELLF